MSEKPEQLIDKKPDTPRDLNSIKGFEWWRRTLQYRTGLGLTEEESKSYQNDFKYKKNLKNCANCNKYLQWMVQYSPIVRFMEQEIGKLDEGFKLSGKNLICDYCEDMKSGGFHPELGILICQNHLLNKYHLEDTLAHELVHYYDNTKFKLNWLNLKHHACSEIRASSLSGECRIMNQFWKGQIKRFKSGHQDCVRRRATLSVMNNPNCASKEQAEKAVDEVWNSCFNDTRPFERIYK